MKVLEQLKKLVANLEVSHAWFTTFSFSPSFFEKYVLSAVCDIEPDNLRTLESYEEINEKLKHIDVKVFYDPSGLNVVEVKKTTCDFIPVHCGLKSLKNMKGIFHPKVYLLLGNDKKSKKFKAYLMTGSVNLTHQAWGLNRETLFFAEVDRKNGKRIDKFFTKIYSGEDKLPEKWYEKLEKENSKWEFKYTVAGENSGEEVLFDEFLNDPKLYVWSPYIDKDIVEVKNKIASGEITLIPGFKNGKVILTRDDFEKLKTFLNVKRDKNHNEVERFTHGKLWLSENKLCIGSWNFTKAAVCGYNFEAGIILENTGMCFDVLQDLDSNLEDFKLKDSLFMSANELKQEQLPQPIKVNFDCSVIAHWEKREYKISIVPDSDLELKIKLPDYNKEIEIKGNATVKFQDIRKIGRNKVFKVFEKGNRDKYFIGFIKEINTEQRPVYGYDNLNQLLNNISLEGKGNTQNKGSRYIYSHNRNGFSEDGINLHSVENKRINYFSLFYLTESLMLKLEELENIEPDKLETQLFDIAYFGADSVEQLVFLSEEWIKDNIDDELVMCCFLWNEVNRVVRKINNLIRSKKLDLRCLGRIRLDKGVKDKLRRVKEGIKERFDKQSNENIEEKIDEWLKYVRE